MMLLWICNNVLKSKPFSEGAKLLFKTLSDIMESNECITFMRFGFKCNQNVNIKKLNGTNLVYSTY